MRLFRPHFFVVCAEDSDALSFFFFFSLTAARSRSSYRFLLNSHAHSPLARAFYVAIKPARIVDKFQDSLYLFLELVRAGVMHGHLWSGRAFSGGPSFGTGEAAFFPQIIATTISLTHTESASVLPDLWRCQPGFFSDTDNASKMTRNHACYS